MQEAESLKPDLQLHCVYINTKNDLELLADPCVGTADMSMACHTTIHLAGLFVEEEMTNEGAAVSIAVTHQQIVLQQAE